MVEENVVEDRGTYVDIDLSILTKNVQTLLKNYPGYQYYMGVVKANSYSHYGILPVKALIAGGINYLVVSSLEEALKIRQDLKEIPILCLQPVHIENLDICVSKQISVTISSLSYLKKIVDHFSGLHVHLKVDTGMNRFGVKTEQELLEEVSLIQSSDLVLEGIYTHIYDTDNETITKRQVNQFQEMICSLGNISIPIIHVANSDTLLNYPKLEIANGVRMGGAMYGFAQTTLPLSTAFTIHSEIIEIKEIQKGETVGYGGLYTATGPERIGVIPIGYADGFIRANRGRNVCVGNNWYPIVGNVCMNMTMIKIDDQIQIGDRVDIIKDRDHLYEICSYLGCIPEEIICSIGSSIPRIYHAERED